MSVNIIATIGNKYLNKSKIREMICAGAGILRFNFSHATHEDGLNLKQIRDDLEDELGIPIALMGDIAGPEVRIFNYSQFQCHSKEQMDIYPLNGEIEYGKIYTNLNLGRQYMEIGQKVRFMDGQLEGKVILFRPDFIRIEFINSALLRENAHFSLPGIDYQLDFLTEKDINDIQFCAENDFDCLALSFIKSSDEILDVRNILKRSAQPDLFLVIKFELEQSLINMQELLNCGDAFFVARGDLGLETDLLRLPLLQKQILAMGQLSGKPVYIATQMAESMQKQPLPTRAEIIDIVQAVLDGASALTLSGETAIGDFPVESVEFMRNAIDHSLRALKKPEYPEEIFYQSQLKKSLDFTALSKTNSGLTIKEKRISLLRG